MVDGEIATAVKTFKTTTEDRITLSNWLSAEAVTQIAMEATAFPGSRSGTSCPMASSS